MIVGGCVSLTVMVNVQLGPARAALQVTVVVPLGKNDPEAGEQEGISVQLLPTVGGG